MASIEISGVTRRYGNYVALQGIDLMVADQEFLVLLGTSGCGKTTLLRLVAGLDSLTEGTIHIGGRDIGHLPPRARGIAMVFQNYAIFPHLTVFDNVAFGLRMKKLPERDIAAKVQNTAELMHIEGLLRRFPGQLSGGQRQRVAVARALVTEPAVLLMDEPLSNLDAILRLEMRAELKSVLQHSRATTIYVTHDQVEAMSLADRIAVMNQGRIVQAAAPGEVYHTPATRFVGGFLGSPPMNFLPAERVLEGWSVAGQTFAGPNGPPERLVFGVRPEDLVPAEVGFHAEIRVIEPLGPSQLVTLTIEGHLCRAFVSNDTRIAPGQSICVSPRTEGIRWFDADSGLAIHAGLHG